MNEQLAAIKARRAAITPGVWEPRGDIVKDIAFEDDVIFYAADSMGPHIESGDWQTAVNQMRADATFIAAAPADMDWLLAEVERLTGALYDDAATKLGDAVLEASRLRREVAALTAERDALAQQLQQAQAQLAGTRSNGKPTPTADEDAAAAARIKRMDEFDELWGVYGRRSINKWPAGARAEYERLQREQNEYEAKYC